MRGRIVSVDRHYYGIRIDCATKGDRWKWRVTLPIGATITSNQAFATPEEALYHGKSWVQSEAAFMAIHTALFELCERGAIHHREYCNLMHSTAEITGHR